MSKSSVAFITPSKSDFAAAQKLGLPVFWFDKSGAADWPGLQKYRPVFYPASQDYAPDIYQRMRDAARAQGISLTLLALPTPSFAYFLDKLYFTPHETIAELEKHIEEYSGESVRLQLATDKNTPQQTDNGNDNGNSNDASATLTSKHKLHHGMLHSGCTCIFSKHDLSRNEIMLWVYLLDRTDWRTGIAQVQYSYVGKHLKISKSTYLRTLKKLDSINVIRYIPGTGQSVTEATLLQFDESYLPCVPTEFKERVIHCRNTANPPLIANQHLHNSAPRHNNR